MEIFSGWKNPRNILFIFENRSTVRYVKFVHGLQAGVYNPVEGVLKSMIHDSPHVLLSHPHLQQMMMLPVLDAAGQLVLDARRQPLMVQPSTGITVPAAEGVVPMSLLKRSGLRDPGAFQEFSKRTVQAKSLR